MKPLFNVAVAAALGLRLHHQFHGPPIDYAGLAAASAASWVGVPGPGEPVLIAAGVFAARHRLDIASVLVVAWVGATLGGVAGWLIGMRAGRIVMVAPGPLRRARIKAIDRGDEIFKRVPLIAILVAPSWISGIHRVRSRVYLPINALSAALWAGGIGLGAYWAGPTVVDFVDDLGWVTGIALLVLILSGILLEIWRRRRRSARELAATEGSSQS